MVLVEPSLRKARYFFYGFIKIIMGNEARNYPRKVYDVN